MKTTLFLSMLTIAIAFTACTKDSPDPETVITKTVTELDAQADSTINTNFGLVHFGPYTKFSFSEGGIVSDSAENWDVAFRATSIIVNGGMKSDPSQPNRTGNAAVYIATIVTMADITSVNTSLLMQDEETSPAIIDDGGMAIPPATEPLGWYLYDHLSNVVSPRPGTILVFRTHDDKYAKVEITFFYDTPNPPSSPTDFGGYYTFNYVYQSDGTTNF